MKHSESKRPLTPRKLPTPHPSQIFSAPLLSASLPPTPRAAIRSTIPHTELVNVGVLAIRSGKTLEWDAPNMKVKNAPEFDPWIKEPTREGWSYGTGLWPA